MTDNYPDPNQPPAAPAWGAPAGPPSAPPPAYGAPQQPAPVLPQVAPPAYGAPQQPAPVQPQVAAPEAFEFGAETVEKKAGIGGRIAIVAVVLAVLGGAAFAVTTALSEPAGSETPDQVAQSMIEALENDDILTMIELMAPSEREAFVEPSLALLEEVARLEEVSVDVEGDLKDFPGEITTFEITYEIESLGGDVHWLTTTGGQVYTTISPADIPEWVKNLDPDAVPTETTEETGDLAQDPVEFAIIEEDGSYYWSLTYTAAEFIRKGIDSPAPSFGNGLVAIGGDSPTKPVEIAINSLMDFDLNGAATQLDPNEFRAFYDYAPLFMGDATDAAAEFKEMIESEGISIEMEDLVTSSVEVNGRTVVTIDSFVVNATYGETGDSMVLRFADGCGTVEITGEDTIDLCEELENETNWDSVFGPDSEITLGWTVVERDGRWYLSGFPSTAGLYTDILRTLTPEQWDDFREDFDGGMADDIFGATGGLSGFGSGFGDDGYDDDFELIEPEPADLDEPADPDIEGGSGLEYDFPVLDTVYVVGDDFPVPGNPSDSYATWAMELSEEPVTSTYLIGDQSLELWEYATPESTIGFETYLVDFWECEVMADHPYGAGAIAVTCSAETYVSYDHWILQTWLTGADAEAPLIRQLDHIRSIDG